MYKDDTGEILADGLFVLNTSLGAADPSELHYAGYGHRVIYLEDARRLIQSVASERDPVNRLMNERLKAFASGAAAEAIDCNGIANGRKLGATSDCALRAFTDKKPFYLRYYQQGIDSFGFRGLAGDADGNIYEVDYDSMGWMRMNLPKGAQLLDDNHTFVMPCPKPTALRKEPSGLVTCSRPIV